MSRTAAEIIKAHERMKTDADKYRNLKKVCTQLAYPMRSEIWDVETDDRGQQRGKEMFDTTAARALEIWGSGIMGYYAPKESPWFTQQLSERSLMQSRTVRKWLQDLDDHMRFSLNRSGSMGVGGYYEAKKTAIMDSGCIGDSYLLIDEDAETGKLMCQTPHPREFTVRRDYFGRVMELHREFKKTVQQVKDEFGDSALTPEQQYNVRDDHGDTEITLIHATDRNPDYDPTKLGYKYMKWRSYIVQTTSGNSTEPDGKIVKEGGYRTLNPIPWSLSRVADENYGRGIVAQLLTEIITANYIGMDMLDVSQQAARPTMIVTSALKHRFTRTPGKTIFTQTEGLAPVTRVGDMVSKLIDTSGYPFGIDMLERWQRMIDQRFGVPLFLSFNQEQLKGETATAYQGRQAERIVLMSPFISTLGSNTDMELDRVLDIELNAGRAPEPPIEVLQAANRMIDVQYIGPLHQRLNQYYGTQSLLRTIEYIREVATIYQDSILVADGDVLLRKLLETNNTPEEIIKDPDVVAEIRQIAAERQEAAMMAELAAKAGPGIKALTGKVEPQSVLAQFEGAAV